MAATFILTNRERAISPIAILVSFRGRKYRKSIGESVPSAQWSDTKKRVRVTARNEDKSYINDRLDLWEESARKAIYYFKDRPYIPEPDEFFHVIDKFRYGKEVSEAVTLLGYFDTFIARYTNLRSPGRVKHYEQAKGIIKRYQEHTKSTLFFEDIDIDFYARFKKWFYDQGYSVNYFGSFIKILKKVMKEAKKVDKLHTSDAYEHEDFKAPQEDADTIYLTVDELIKMHRLKITPEMVRQNFPLLADDKVKKKIEDLDKARNLFLIGAFTGLRVSEYKRLSQSNVSKRIKIRTNKTNANAVIPIHWVVREILDGGYDFETTMSETMISRYIKIVARLAGINDDILIYKSKSGKPVEMVKKKYLLISTHTARRSFATNGYKAGIPVPDLMKITTHRTVASFLRYIRISEEENAERLEHHSFFTGKEAGPDAEPNYFTASAKP